jgi:tetratricopeptide (TPR) repeat protein
MTPRPGIALATLLAASALGGCAHRESWADVHTPVVLVEVLPPQAEVVMDGRPLGRGSGTQPVPDRRRRYRFQATAEGYEPLEVEVEGEKLAGAEVRLVLRPAGFGRARRLEAGEPAGLAQAAAALLRAERVDDAILYAERSLTLAETPLAHKVVGRAYGRKGNKKESVRHYSAYLTLAPDAPDAREIADAVEKARGDLTIPIPAGR